ncbi:unnamed protein product, partial [Discosporangium mesarthrocarpum]
MQSTRSVLSLQSAVFVKKKATLMRQRVKMRPFTLDPRTPRMRVWENYLTITILYTVLVVPWRISFNSRAGTLGMVIDSLVNLSFVIDTARRFVTAIPTENGLVTAPWPIARRYLGTWFLVDLASCMPLTTLLRDKVAPSVRVVHALRGLRLLRLLKVVKVYAMHYEVKHNCVKEGPVAMSIGKTLLTVILAAHLLSCLWFYV